MSVFRDSVKIIKEDAKNVPQNDCNKKVAFMEK
jgi:hypothetical protein